MCDTRRLRHVHFSRRIVPALCLQRWVGRWADNWTAVQLGWSGTPVTFAARKLPIACLFLALVTLALAAIAARGHKPPHQSAEFFEARIRPLLAEHCFSCRGPDTQLGGLRLDLRETALKGGIS